MASLNPNRAEIVVIGGGIVGCSIAYHLALLGCHDVVVLDSGSLAEPRGSTGHAPGLIGQVAPSAVLTSLARYSTDLYSRLPHEQPAFSRVGSIEVARTDARLVEFRNKAAYAAHLGIAAELISVERIHEIVPFMDTRKLVGGLFVPTDGVAAAVRALSALASRSVASGVQVLEHVTARGIRTSNGRVQGVQTPQGDIECQQIVVAAGIWGSHLLQKTIGSRLPLFPVQHPYLKTAPLTELSAFTEHDLYPLVRDIDNRVYFRQHGRRLGFGWYSHTPAVADVGESSAAELPYVASIFNDRPNFSLFPFLEHAPITYQINGLFSMTPDGLPLLGEHSEVRNLWLAEAVWFTHAGGVGKLMADLIMEGRSPFDWRGLDVRRFDGTDREAWQSTALDLYTRIYDWPEGSSLDAPLGSAVSAERS
jgi:dimethylglycine oxidase